jgi:homoserine dehydrogenase
MRRQPVIVLKFGSSVLRSEGDLPRAVHEIYRWVREGHRVVAVVSALGDTTDRLLQQAEHYGDEPDWSALAALLATGEATSAALLGLALDRAGVPAVVLDAERIGLRTTGRVLNAQPDGVDVSEIRRVLEECPVAVVPGFVGRTREGGPSVLGRGGSDLTALFLAQQLYADRCRLIKDVLGLYERDPAKRGPRPRRYGSLTWDDATHLGGGVVQPKALRFAREHHITFEVSALGTNEATVVGGDVAEFATDAVPARPLRIGLLGLGTVGYGVYRELAAHPEWFEVTGIAVRRLDRGDARENDRGDACEDAEVPNALLTRDPWEVIAGDCDVVVEAFGGISPAKELIASALQSGTHVVTANKLVLARYGAALRQTAAEGGARLLASAAVGGAVPVLESLERLAETATVRSVEGVINGTCNFVLDELARGLSFDDAVALAQACGFAEADPSFDLDGSDVACKLILLARAAFGADLEFDSMVRSGISELDPRHVFDLYASGRAVRLVGSVKQTPDGLVATIEPRVLEGSHPLAAARREHNCVIVELANSERVVLRGKGAGRWPTTEAVFADLMTLARERSQSDSQLPEVFIENSCQPGQPGDDTAIHSQGGVQ